MKKFHIALFCLGTPGGSTEVAVNLALSLRHRGHTCDLFAYHDSQRERLFENGIRLLTPGTLDYPIFDHIQTDFGFLPTFDKQHKKSPYDLIHIHYAVPLIHVMTNLQEIYGLPCVVTFHGSDATIMPDLFDATILSRLIAKSGAAITVASQFLAAKVAEVYQLPSGGVRIIPNTIAPEYFEEYPRQENAPPYFLHCSSLRPVKRAWDIILALCCLNKQAQYRASLEMPRLKIVGDGPDLPDLRLLVEKCKLHDLVDFPGRIEDKHALAQLATNAKALILASLMESQPLVALEAMALGTPVISSNYPSAAELIGEDGERGRLFEVGDCQQMAQALASILENPAQAAEMAARARAFVLREHHPDRVIAAYLDLYAETTGRRAG